jgi:hypothetical protein
MPLGSKANIKAGDVAKGIKNHKGLVILDRNGTQLIVGIQAGPASAVS